MYSLISAKESVKAADEFGIKKEKDIEKVIFSALFNTKAKKEGVEAFVNKRKPNFAKM